MNSKKKLFRRIISFALSLVLFLGSFSGAGMLVQAASENLALNKPVVVSGIEGGYQADGTTLVYPQFTAEHLTDGRESTRWSSNAGLTSLDLSENPEQNVWAYVDLEEEVSIGEIQLKWADANSRDYDIQVSLDAQEWTVLKNYQEPDNTGRVYTEILQLEQPVSARYVRVYARLGTWIQAYNYECPTISLNEIEIYQYRSEADLQNVLDAVMSEDVTANEDYSKLILPQVPEGFSINLYASSNLAVVDLEGTIIQPLEDMNVNLFYEVTAADGTSLKSDDPKRVIIEGLYEESESINEKPAIVPEIREWKGNEGVTIFNDTIVIESEDLRATAEQIAMYLKEMSDIDATITTGTPTTGNIYLKLDENSVLGDEGYTMEIADIVTVTAKTEEGILYGGTTISQILSQAEDHHSMPRGMMRDYPQYEIRAVMIDVARFYVPLDYLQEMTRYAGYFKMSEFRNHINDNGGEQTAAFRVESKVYPQLNDGLDPENVYSQSDYIAYQKDAKKYGVDVVTEIDTPAHAGAIGKIDESLLMDGYHLDLRTEEAYQRSVNVMKEIFDEFLDGEDPVFQNGKFHIGTDEYNKSYSEVLRRYMDELINYVNAKGYESRFWASLGTNGFAGTTPVSTDVLAHMWSHSWASFDEMKEDGYKFINNADGILYIVPSVGYYNDYLNIINLYNTWEYTNLNGGYHLAAGHPQLLGAEAALWYDQKVGSSEFDVFDRFRDQIMLMAEKGWYGDKDDETGEEFIQRVEAVGKVTPKANPARYVESVTSLAAFYDFEQIENHSVKDASGNGYDADLNGLYVKDGALRLNGEGYASLPFDSFGFPYTVQFDLTIDKATPSNALVFEGKDGKLFYDYDGTGNLGYERKGYSYIIDAEIPVGVDVNITLTCDAKDTTLYINGMKVGSGKYYQVTGASKQGSGTFVLPTEKIGSGIYGTMDNLKLYNYAMNSSEVAGSEDATESGNIALNKPVTVSGVEGGYEDDGVTLVYPQFNPIHATDGNTSTRISLNRDHDAWVVVDLGKSYLLEKTSIRFGELPNAYAILVSDDGEEWTKVDERTGLNGGSSSVDVIEFDKIVSARYIKYQQIEMFPAWGSTYSGNFSEFEVYGFDVDKYVNVVTEAKAVVEGFEVTPENEAFLGLLDENIAKLEAMLTTGPISEMELVAGVITQQLDMLAEGNIPQTIADKSELEGLLNESLLEESYSENTWNYYLQALNFAKSVYYSVKADQAMVNYACEMVNNAKNKLGMKNYVTITTNRPIYEDYALAHLIDNDTDTLTWTSGDQNVNDYIKFEFRDTLHLTSITLDSTNTGADGIHGGKVEAMVDGTWKTLGTIGENEIEELTFEAVDTRSVRIVITEKAAYWWKLREVTFNDTAIRDTEVLEKELSSIEKEELYTEDSYAVYEEALAQGTAVKENIQSNQGEIDAAVDAILAAKEGLVKKLDKQELKTLLDNKEEGAFYTAESYEAYEAAYNVAKLVYDDSEASQNDVDVAVWNILEAKSLLQKVVHADYTAVNEAKAAAEVLVKENYKDFSAVEEAIAAIVEGKDITEQEEVDAMAKAITDAIAALEYKDADYTAVNAAKETVDSLVKENYKDFSAVEEAVAAIVEGKDITEQEEVDAMAKAITDAVAALEYKDADYAEVNAAIEAAEVLVKTNYKDFSAVEEAIEAVLTGKNITEQSEVDAYAKAINDAVAALELRDANYTVVNEAKAAANALVRENYKDLSAVDAAVAAVVEGKKITEQSEVDAYAKAINDAIKALELKDADYTAVDKALVKIPEDLDGYTKESVEALKAAVEAIQRNFDITKQDEVDAMAKAVEEAIAGLKKKPAPSQPSQPSTPALNQPVSPATGDVSVTMIYIMVMMVTAAIVLVKRRKKE